MRTVLRVDNIPLGDRVQVVERCKVCEFEASSLMTALKSSRLPVFHERPFAVPWLPRTNTDVWTAVDTDARSWVGSEALMVVPSDG